MIVGEAPGAVEDAQGSPFVGPSGHLLRETLRELTTDALYITNVVKCFPSATGTPKAEHIEACRAYLDEEIRAVNPTHILCLGGTAARAVLRTRAAITKIAGSVSNVDGRTVIVTYHPAAVLRMPKLYASWLSDVALFSRMVSAKTTLVDPPVRPIVVTDARDIHSVLESIEGDRVAVDFEAVDLPWWHKDFAAWCVSVSDGKTTVVLPLDHPHSPAGAWGSQATKDALRAFASTRRVIMHNAMYDALVWRRVIGTRPDIACDTMVVAHLINENQAKGLKRLARDILLWRDWSVPLDASTPYEELATYNGVDAAATALIAPRLIALLKRDERLLSYAKRVAMRGLRAVIDMCWHGMPIDVGEAQQRASSITSELDAIRSRLPFNPLSPAQIVKDMREKGIIAPGMKPTTEETFLLSVKDVYREAHDIIAARRLARYASTYYRAFIEMERQSHIRSRIFPEYRPCGTETGRYSSRIHTVPRDAKVRSIFRASKGSTLLSVDYAQIEARLAAWDAAGRPAKASDACRGMCAAFLEGRDVYKETASYILGKDPTELTKEERTTYGKIPTLACIYQISPEGLMEYAKSHGVEWSYVDAVMVHKAFYEKWPEIARWHSTSGGMLVLSSAVRSAIGRVRRFPRFYVDRAPHEATKEAINAPIQSLASDITLNALVETTTLLERTGWGRPVAFIHDAILFELDGDEDDERVINRALAVAETMRLAHESLRPLGLALPEGYIEVEASIGPWGEGRPLTKVA